MLKGHLSMSSLVYGIPRKFYHGEFMSALYLFLRNSISSQVCVMENHGKSNLLYFFCISFRFRNKLYSFTSSPLAGILYRDSEAWWFTSKPLKEVCFITHFTQMRTMSPLENLDTPKAKLRKTYLRFDIWHQLDISVSIIVRIQALY